jgi:pyruvate/2-oxoglutarate dehydrogenase complex dihydrolipoamide dehydrogenase (E3) component
MSSSAMRASLNHRCCLPERLLRFKKAIVATGARPRPSDIPGLEQIGYLTSDSIFELTELPRRLASSAAVRSAANWHKRSAGWDRRVTIVQNLPKFLPNEERDAADLLSRSMSRDGVETRLNTKVVGARMQGAAKLLDTINDDAKCSIAVDEIVLSIGRTCKCGRFGTCGGGRRVSTRFEV